MTENIYKRILWFGMAAIIVFSPLGKGAARIWSITPILLVSYVLIFIWLWRMNDNRPREFRRTSIDIPIILFAMLAIVSTFFSIYKHDSLYSLLKLFCYAGIYYLIVYEFDRTMVKRILYLVIAMGAVLSVYGLLQYLNILGHSWWDPGKFIAATFVNHNHFSGYLELAMPVAVIFLIRRSASRASQAPTGSSTLLKLLVLSALVVMMVTFILAQSRAAWISLGASFLVMISLFARRRDGGMRRAVILVLLAAAIISLAYFGRDVISERISGAISSEPAGASFATRLKIWHGAIDMIRQNPIAGTGIGTFVLGFPRHRPEGLSVLANFAHNDYLETACEIGIPALIVMLWIITAVIRTGMKEDNVDSYRLGCAIGLLSLSLHAMSDFNFHIPANMILSVIYSAVIMRGRG